MMGRRSGWWVKSCGLRGQCISKVGPEEEPRPNQRIRCWNGDVAQADEVERRRGPCGQERYRADPGSGTPG